MLVWMDGFDHYNGAWEAMDDGSYAIIGGGFQAGNLNASNKRTGSHSWNSWGTALWRKVLPVGVDEVGVGMAIYPAFLPGESGNCLPILQLMNFDGDWMIRLDVMPTGAFRVQRNNHNNTVTTIYTSPNEAVVANSFQHVEFVCRCHDTAGYVGIAVNGRVIADVSGLDTRGGAAAVFDMVQQARNGYVGNPFQAPGMDVDDLFIRDNRGTTNNTGFLGDRQVQTMYPDADGAAQDWTRSNTAIPAFDVINDPYSDTDNIAATAPNQVAEFGLQDLPPEVTNVAGVMTLARVRKSDAGDARLQVSLVSGGSADPGEDRPITTAYTYWADISEYDPATGLKWTPSAVNAAQLRLTRTV